MGKRHARKAAIARNLGLGLALAATGCGLFDPLGGRPSRAELTNRQILVMYREGAIPGPLEYQGRLLNVVGAFDLASPVRVYDVPPGLSTREAAEAFRRLPEVAAAIPNQVKHWSAQPNDPYLPMQWAYRPNVGLGAQKLWDAKDDTSGVTVAVLDSGIDWTHPEFRGDRVLLGKNTLEDSQDPAKIMDYDGHGTHVAGIIGAAGNNAQGVAGVAWNVKFLAVKVLDKDGGNDASALAGIAYAVKNGAKVINMSFNSKDTSLNPLYENAVKMAREAGVVVVGAAGNDGGPVTQPANTPGVLAVGALAGDGVSRSAFSNYYLNDRSLVPIWAPGERIYSTVSQQVEGSTNRGYGYDTGTSMAAPFVSAAAAIIRARHADWSAEQVEKAVLAAVQPLQGGINRLDFSKLP